MTEPKAEPELNPPSEPSLSLVKEQAMEVHHAPERPIHSVKEFVLALTTITIGILIAMSLEGVVTWSHHRALVREAKARLAEEIAENRRDVAAFLKKVADIKASHDHVLQFIDDIAARRLPKGTTVDLHNDYDIMELARTSWETTQATGALSYMDYADAQRYAAVYNLQARMGQFQDRLLEAFITGFLPPGMDPETATPAELRAWKRSVGALWQQVDGQRQIAEDLVKEYDKVLSQR